MEAEAATLKLHKDQMESELTLLEDEVRAAREDKSSWTHRLTALANEKQVLANGLASRILASKVGGGRVRG